MGSYQDYLEPSCRQKLTAHIQFLREHEPERFSRNVGRIDGFGELQDANSNSPSNIFTQELPFKKYRVPQEIREQWHDLLSSGINEITAGNRQTFKKLVRQGVPDEYRCEVW